MGAVTFLVGGVRSGKSALAIRLASRHDGRVELLATAEPFDDDLRQRVERHRADRPPWPTIEEPVDLAGAVGERVDAAALLVVDCLTVWVANLLHRDEDADSIVERAHRLADALAARAGPAVVVSNEVGLGVHPPTDLGRCFADVLGHVNQAVAARADRSMLLVAGMALPLVAIDDLEGLVG